jgi:hypothetical protein
VERAGRDASEVGVRFFHATQAAQGLDAGGHALLPEQASREGLLVRVQQL